MKRRGFLATLLGLAAAPAAARLPVPAAAPVASAAANPLFAGEIGRYDSVRLYSRHVADELRHTFADHRWRDDEIRALQREQNRRAALALNKLRGPR